VPTSACRPIFAVISVCSAVWHDFLGFEVDCLDGGDHESFAHFECHTLHQAFGG
jgi:hypothetical protein